MVVVVHFLDDDSDFLELSLFAGLQMEYGDIPRAGIITRLSSPANSSKAKRQGRVVSSSRAATTREISWMGSSTGSASTTSQIQAAFTKDSLKTTTWRARAR